MSLLLSCTLQLSVIASICVTTLCYSIYIVTCSPTTLWCLEGNLHLLGPYNTLLQAIITLSLIHILYNSLYDALSLLRLRRLSPGNGYQRRRFRVPRLLSSLTGISLTNQLYSRPRLRTRGRLTRNHLRPGLTASELIRSPSRLMADPTQNTTYNKYPIVVFMSVAVIT